MGSETSTGTESTTGGTHPPAHPSAHPETHPEATAVDVWRTFGVFTASTLAFSWGLWATLVFGLVPASATTVLIAIGGFGPFVGALVTLSVSGWSVRRWLRANLRVRLPLRWYAYALGLPVVFAGVAGLVHMVAFGGTLALDALPPLWVYPVGLVVVFLVGGGQEELGWRAFALPALQGRYSAFVSSLVVGGLWFVWHLPLFLVPNSSQNGLPLLPYAVGVLATSVVLAWLYNATGSVLIPMLFHGGVNPVAAFFPTGGVEALSTVAGYGSYTLVVTVAVVVLVAVYGADNLARRSRVALESQVGP